MRRRPVATSSLREPARELSVVWVGGDRHRISVRNHHVLIDQPRCDGGDDAGPTPVELFIGSLASCVSHYARRGLGPLGPGPAVHCSWTMSDTAPWRVATIEVDVQLPEGTSVARRAAVERAIAHCTVQNTLADPPAIRVAVDTWSMEPRLAAVGSGSTRMLPSGS
jgi:uncharacterized OsmC-like protein